MTDPFEPTCECGCIEGFVAALEARVLEYRIGLADYQRYWSCRKCVAIIRGQEPPEPPYDRAQAIRCFNQCFFNVRLSDA